MSARMFRVVGSSRAFAMSEWSCMGCRGRPKRKLLARRLTISVRQDVRPDVPGGGEFASVRDERMELHGLSRQAQEKITRAPVDDIRAPGCPPGCSGWWGVRERSR